MHLNLGGSVILITGGTDGLGAALAARLVSEGARVAVCGRDLGRVEETRSRLIELARDPQAVLAVPADVTRSEELEAFVAAAVGRWGRIDGLVNNAGRHWGGPFEEMTDDDWAGDLELKVFSAARAIRLVLPQLRAGGGGAILNVLSISAKAPGAGTMPTAAARAAGMALTQALSKELGPDGIRVNAVLIGLVESGQWRRRAEQAGRPEPEFYRELAARNDIPLGRIGRSEEFADLASFLLSERAGFITGTAINLDGGASPVL
jgi:NAD(P)-dependent dehydrogenase (short-subunit alcohol dehydrogenase family)